MRYLQQPMRQKCAQMRLSVVQFESHQIHPFADLIGCRPSRCQRSTDQVAEGIKILPLPAVRFHFDPLHARTGYIDIQDRAIRHLVGNREGGGAARLDFIFCPDMFSPQQSLNEDIVDEAPVPHVAEAQIQARLGDYRGPEALQLGHSGRTQHVGGAAAVDDPAQQEPFFLGFAEPPLAKLFAGDGVLSCQSMRVIWSRASQPKRLIASRASRRFFWCCCKVSMPNIAPSLSIKVLITPL